MQLYLTCRNACYTVDGGLGCLRLPVLSFCKVPLKDLNVNLVFFFLKVGFNGFDVNKLFAPLESSNDSVPFRLSKERKYLHHKLFQAVVEDDLLALNTLIKKQVDFGIQDFDKRTPL